MTPKLQNQHSIRCINEYSFHMVSSLLQSYLQLIVIQKAFIKFATLSSPDIIIYMSRFSQPSTNTSSHRFSNSAKTLITSLTIKKSLWTSKFLQREVNYRRIDTFYGPYPYFNSLKFPLLGFKFQIPSWNSHFHYLNFLLKHKKLLLISEEGFDLTPQALNKTFFCCSHALLASPTIVNSIQTLN